MIGRRFKRLVVEEFHHKDKQWHRYWTCLCDCGKRKIIEWSHLCSGDTTSCGCYAKECRLNNKNSLIHGYSSRKKVSSIYSSWRKMLSRIRGTHSLISRKYYIEKHIECDPSWLWFELFLLDMQEGYFDGFDLHRKDPDGPYCKSNCEWLPRGEHIRKHRQMEKEKRRLLNL